MAHYDCDDCGLNMKTSCTCPPTPPKKEMVNHPQHYNSHPSGVEAIEVCRLLPFNLGNAVKYTMRRDDKGTPKQDIQKALWYVRDEIRYMHSSAHIGSRLTAIMLLERIFKAESNRYAKAFYLSMMDYCSETYQQRVCLDNMVSNLIDLLESKG